MTRIIGGKHRGRALKVPVAGVRPTADRAREALFNILAHGIDWPGFEGASVLDVFAGTGACGLEALSRGATHATFVDVDGAVLQTIRRNAAAMGEARTVTMLKLDATRLAAPPATTAAPGVLAFLDPPYEIGLAAPALHRPGDAPAGWRPGRSRSSRWRRASRSACRRTTCCSTSAATARHGWCSCGSAQAPLRLPAQGQPAAIDLVALQPGEEACPEQRDRPCRGR